MCVAMGGCADGCACGDSTCIEDRCEGAPSAEDQARLIAEREARRGVAQPADSEEYARELLEVRAQAAALGPEVPAALTPVAFADAVPEELPAAVPDARSYLEEVSQFFVDAAVQAGREGWIDPLDEVNNEIDFTTPDGLCIRAKVDVKRFPREVARLERARVRRAPAGTATLEIRPEAITTWVGAK
jgi:hypothetical protein